MLSISKIDVYYGNVQVLWDISAEVNKCEIVALIGANGAGKTTLMMTISGLLKPRSGSIEFNGVRIDGAKSHDIVRLGVVQVPQGAHVFPEMTVKENLELATYRMRNKNRNSVGLEKAYEHFSMLGKRKNQKAGLLSGGEQQMLAFARGVMLNPILFLLDEPSSGLAPIVVKELGNKIETLSTEEELTVLIVEQNADLALGISDRGYVLQSGQLVTSGDSVKLKDSVLVKKAFLGL